MKRMLILSAAALVTAVPAVIGLLGNQSFAQSVPVKVPSQVQAHVVPTDDKGTHVEPGDDRGSHAVSTDLSQGSRSSSRHGSGSASGGDDGSGHK